jgi:hypothetical protein
MYMPYQRKDAPPDFELYDWREAIVALAAHEGWHHKQTPRHGYGYRSPSAKRAPARFVEVECDWAAYRAILRHRERVSRGHVKTDRPTATCGRV